MAFCMCCGAADDSRCGWAAVAFVAVLMPGLSKRGGNQGSMVLVRSMAVKGVQRSRDTRSGRTQSIEGTESASNSSVIYEAHIKLATYCCCCCCVVVVVGNEVVVPAIDRGEKKKQKDGAGEARRGTEQTVVSCQQLQVQKEKEEEEDKEEEGKQNTIKTPSGTHVRACTHANLHPRDV